MKIKKLNESYERDIIRYIDVEIPMALKDLLDVVESLSDNKLRELKTNLSRFYDYIASIEPIPNTKAPNRDFEW